ncbi:PREDICTED: uncharacterized protein LOC108661383 [Theobroma cacao]|uniref:Uncharacterized protein LOC108661383 n=1 Tax=Theobroma cacao TaxID=3641 RepID=A0AB32W2P9_THECC|nr:PREDICTED: uncharacterized protein LOC108661383 [Theobroma cacao]
MPGYVKFFKDILLKRRKLGEFETIALTKECSAIIQNKLPPKLKDPGSFTIPRTIGALCFAKALCDLGAKDVFVKVDKFIFLVDFIILDMEKDREIPISLGRPILRTARALIDVEKVELTLKVEDQ